MREVQSGADLILKLGIHEINVLAINLFTGLFTSIP